MDDRLLDYFMKETDRKFDEMRQDFKESISTISDQLKDLTKFKIEMVVSARFTSIVVSAVCGLVTMLISAWVSARISGHG